MVLSALFLDYFLNFRDFCNFAIGFPAFEMALFHFINAEINIKVAEIVEIAEIAEIVRKVPL